jgi:hypothetical protein
MVDGFKEVEDKKAADRKRREKLDEEESSVKSEVIEKSEFYANKKRGDYITDNIDETPNVQ